MSKGGVSSMFQQAATCAAAVQPLGVQWLVVGASPNQARKSFREGERKLGKRESYLGNPNNLWKKV